MKREPEGIIRSVTEEDGSRGGTAAKKSKCLKVFFCGWQQGLGRNADQLNIKSKIKLKTQKFKKNPEKA